MPLAKRSIMLMLLALAACAVLAAPAAAVDKKLHIKHVSEMGSLIELEDGSLWDVPNPVDQEVAYTWPNYAPAILRNNRTLINVNTGDDVTVYKRKDAPQKGAAAVPPPPAAPLVHPAMQSGAAAPMPKNLEERLQRMEGLLNAIAVKLDEMDKRLGTVESLAGVKPQ